MNKYLCSLLCMVVGLMLFSGCGSLSNSHPTPTEGTDWEPTIYETVNNLDGVTMSAKEETVSSTGLTVAFKNNSDKQCIYGDDFLLEKEIDGGWYQVPIALADNYGFNDIGYDLANSDVREWTVDWGWLYGKLDTGEYRIVKSILDFRSARNYDKCHLTAEFTIE
ncbi:immunoglobulin-like domain-containing protein [Bacillus horti]|uniref:Bacterial Ig-like domain-containing protein n=1 Tax=Caldalkalibacillus horti TaxID=77523 RepID=A0ABT9VX57_9BACI|nr:immunoglobulin-like domain-containing protein [Bacillus horti]MDQ0165578.1 hypothetical protein [Bacillus horti]